MISFSMAFPVFAFSDGVSITTGGGRHVENIGSKRSHSRTCLHSQIPCYRDINRKFRQIRSLCEILNADTRAISKAFSKISYATEQGIISAEQGILTQEQGILPTKSEIIIG